MAIRNAKLGGTDWSDGNTLVDDDINDTFDATVSVGANTNPTQAPVGAVVAWLKSFTNVPGTLPTGWVECDGSTISDSDSPMNGETLPDLNSPVDTGLKGTFLRGHTTSGLTETSQNLAHTHTYSRSGGAGNGYEHNGDTDIHNTTQNTGSEGGDEARPHNYSVVWVMRIK